MAQSTKARWLVRTAVVVVVVGGAAAAIPSFWPGLIWQTQSVQGLAAKANAEQGKYIFAMTGCASCHTDTKKGAAYLAGGRRLKTTFGVFVAPNITPDKGTGIGGWSTEDFVRAMTVGVSPDGRHYYPSFPYTSYTQMSVKDLVDLKAYLDTVKPVTNRTAPHDLKFPYGLRPALGLWKALYFTPRRFVPVKGKSAQWNRGAYIVNGPGHCAECHTPRNFAGAFRRHMMFSGTIHGPEGSMVHNITPDKDTGIGKWSADDVVFALQTGLMPSGDSFAGSMGEVVQNGTSKLTDYDLAAIASYLRGLPPIRRDIGKLKAIADKAKSHPMRQKTGQPRKTR